MPQPAIIILAVCVVYFPFLVFLLFYPIKKRYKNYSIFSFWISNLGEKSSASYSLYAPAFLIFSFLVLFVAAILYGLLPNTVFSVIAIAFLYLGGISVLFTVLFPIDSSPRVHLLIAAFTFLGIIGSAAFLIYPIYVSSVLPDYLIVLNIIILLFAAVFSYSTIRLNLKYGGEAIQNLVKIRKIEKSFILKNAAVWEWITFIALILWLFILSVIILSILIAI